MRLLVLVVLTAQLAACSLHVGSDNAVLTQQDLHTLPQWQSSSAESAVRAGSLFGLLDSPQLRLFVDEALVSNPNLQQTALSLQILQAELRQARGNQMVQVDAGLSGSKEEGSDESYSGALSVSWTLDIWGKLRDTTAAAGMDVQGQAELLRYARAELAAEVMDSWLQLVATSHSIGIQAKRVDTLRKTENYILSRYRSGLGDLQDLDSARSATSSARATLVEYQETLKRLQRTLQLLVGMPTPLEVTILKNYPVVLTPWLMCRSRH